MIDRKERQKGLLTLIKDNLRIINRFVHFPAMTGERIDPLEVEPLMIEFDKAIEMLIAHRNNILCRAEPDFRPNRYRPIVWERGCLHQYALIGAERGALGVEECTKCGHSKPSPYR